MSWDGELTDLFWVGTIVLGDTQEEADLPPVERTSLSRNGLPCEEPGGKYRMKSAYFISHWQDSCWQDVKLPGWRDVEV